MNKNNGGPAFPTPIDGVGNYADPHYAKEGVQGPGMTLREYACIHLRVPETNHDWLNELIRTAQRDELAAKAMPVAMEKALGAPTDEGLAEAMALVPELAQAMADAMLKAREQ